MNFNELVILEITRGKKRENYSQKKKEKQKEKDQREQNRELVILH